MTTPIDIRPSPYVTWHSTELCAKLRHRTSRHFEFFP